jgi:glutamyl-tRNA synthetase
MYHAALEQLKRGGFIYPCTCSRKDIQSAVSAPHAGDDQEPLYAGTCRGKRAREVSGRQFSWRFRVPDCQTICFTDENFGPQQFVTGRDFGDFVVWRPDGVPSYQLACVADDAAMQITEVVRGADLLMSTARQILLYRALGFPIPRFFHCELVRDESGVRLAKRHEALSLRTLRARNVDPATLRK